MQQGPPMRRILVLIVLLCLIAAACTTPPPDAPIPIRMLESWQTQQDTLTPQDALRDWRFNGRQGEAIRLRLEAKTGGQVSLTLRDPAGNPVAQGDDLSLTLTTTGIYTVQIRLAAGEGTTYSLSLSYPDQNAPTFTPSLTPSLTPSATLTPSKTLTPSLTPSFTLTPSQTLTPTPTLTPSFTMTPSQTLTPSQTYTPSHTPTPVYAPLGTLTGRLTLGASVDGSYLSPFERHIYVFDGVADQRVTLEMRATSGSVDPVLTLFDPEGKPLATDDNSGGDRSALLRDIRLPVSGEYVVQALGSGTGGYRISLLPTAPPPLTLPTSTPTPPLGTVTPVAAVEQLGDHVLAVGMIERGGDFDRYFIEADAGEFLTIGVRPVPGSALRPRIEVYTPVGELMVGTSLGADGQALIPGLGTIEAGSYDIFISGDGRTTGAYTIAYGRGMTNVDNRRGSLAPQNAAPGGGIRAIRDEWTLPLNAGDVIDVQAQGASLRVVAPDGTEVASGDNSLQFNAGDSGDYLLYATGTAYQLTWNYIVAAPTPAAPLLILSADDALAAQTYLYYAFQGEAGQEVHIRVDALSAGLDPVAALLDADDATVASGDDSPNSLNPDFRATLPAAGTYRLRVNAYGEAGGAVSVTVEMLS
jgi:hypothetical protein